VEGYVVESIDLTAWLKKKQSGPTCPEIRVKLDTGVEVPAEILNVSRVGLHVRVPVHLDDGAVLGFGMQDCTAIGQVLYCRPDGNQVFAALMISGDRRREPRLSASEQVTLRVISPQEPGSIRGRLIDVSQSGIGLIIESVVSVGTLVEVQTDGENVLYGAVRNCTKVPADKFRIGILAEETFFGDLREKHLFSFNGMVRSVIGSLRKGFARRLERYRQNY
jgi:hypothetical protein